VSRPDDPGAPDRAIFFAGAYFAARDGNVEATPAGATSPETFTPDGFRDRLALLGRLADDAEAGRREGTS
jgi:hypothetical protein